MPGIYLWDMAYFQQQLGKMRHVLTHKATPNYAQHFQMNGVFTNHPPKSFSLVGSACISLRLLSYHLSSSVKVPIICPYTMEAVGSCRVELRALAQDHQSDLGSVSVADGPITAQLKPGDNLTFILNLDQVKGLTSNDFSTVHAQIQLSSLLGLSIPSENTFASLPIDLDTSSCAHLNLRRTVTTVVTPEIVQHLGVEYATIMFFAKANLSYLDRLERWDKTREAATSASSTGHTSPDERPITTPVKPSMRRCETDFVGPEKHDILACIEIQELASNGEYRSAEVDNETFGLHQGLQRRIKLVLHHDSGRALAWTKIHRMNSTDIRLVENGNIGIVGQSEVEIKALTQEVEFRSDGTSTLEFTGVWDTSAHYCSHLDRKTASNQSLLLKLNWTTEFDNLDQPAPFSIDLRIQILGRDHRKSSLRSFFGGSSMAYSSIVGIHQLHLNPPLTRFAEDLWRLDTANKHVRGQEGLGDWRPRSLSLLDDFQRMRRSEKGLADLQSTLAVLDMVGELDSTWRLPKSAADQEELLRRCLALWRKEMDSRHLVG